MPLVLVMTGKLLAIGFIATAIAAFSFHFVPQGAIDRVFHSEAQSDVVSLRDDVRLLRQEVVILRADLHTLWMDARSQVARLQADIFGNTGSAAQNPPSNP
jgi:hypothetical protein